MAFDLRRELADPVGEHAKCGLRQNAFGTFLPELAAWLPYTGDHPSPERGPIERELGMPLFSRTVISQEVPYGSGTEADTVATVKAGS